MTETGYLDHHFLLAMPGLRDPNFSRTVTYLCSHSLAGAMGLVINQPSGLTLGELMEQLELAPGICGNQPVLSGGPVEPERGFILHTDDGQQYQSSMPLGHSLRLTASLDILAAMAEGRGPGHTLVALGYAGWAPGQLERELADNAWLTVPADSVTLFETPLDDRMRVAAGKLGIDLSRLGNMAGHA